MNYHVYPNEKYGFEIRRDGSRHPLAYSGSREAAERLATDISIKNSSRILIHAKPFHEEVDNVG